MSKYDGKLLARARMELDNIKSANLAEQQRRRSLVYLRVPEIADIDRAMQRQMLQLARFSLSGSGDVRDSIAAIRDENLALQRRKAELLQLNGFSADFLDEIYTCPKCHDSGMYENSVCTCLQKLYNKELTKDLAVLLRKGDESFERFDLSLYSDRYLPKCNVVPREAMRIVFAACLKFADNFPKVSSNLLLTGGTGLGKTYLSACIARRVAEKGYSVCYDTAVSALEAFERNKFARDSEESEKYSARVSRILGCDLMILDDLGTEMLTAMTVSSLYTLINTRLINGRPTVISTNLGLEELEKRYGAQTASRLRGEYLSLPFAGTDIRLLRKG